MKFGQIMSIMDELNRNRIAGTVSNYYRNISIDTDVACFFRDKNAVAFGIRENALLRVYFMGVKEEVSGLLCEFPKESVMDCVSRKQVDYTWIGKSGFVRKEELLRYTNTDMTIVFMEEQMLRREVVSEEPYYLASSKDLEKILKLIYRHFDVVSSHYPSSADVMRLIEQELVWIVKERGEITSLALCALEGKKFYLNYLLNLSEKVSGRNLLARAMCEVIDRGCKYGYMWVSKDNTRAIHVYESLLYNPDGVKNTIFVKEN